MIATSDRFSEALEAGYQLAVAVEVFGSEGGTGQILEPLSGSVTLDLTAAVRGTCELEFADPALAPNDAGDPLAPFGNELKVSRGIRTSDGYEELLQLGVFGIQETVVSDSREGLRINVAGEDRSRRIADAIFEADFTISAGADYLDTIREIVDEAGFGVETDFLERTLLTVTLNGTRGDDRWEFVQAMAAMIGCDLYFNGQGVLVLTEIPAAGIGTPAAYIVEGENGAEVHAPSLTDFSESFSRRDAHNRWIVVGDNPDSEGAAPPSATVTDEDSPAAYDGPFGKKPEVFHSSFIGSDEQAADAAEGKRQRERGILTEVGFGAFVNPALEPGDNIHVKRTRRDADGNLVTLADEMHVIDSLTIPLSADGVMSGSTRAIFSDEAF